MTFSLISYQDIPFWKLEASPGPIAGSSGPLFRYALHIEQGLSLRRNRAADQIARILSDERGWIRGAVRFQRVSQAADTDLLIASPASTDALCLPLQTEGKVSCCNGRRVVINVERWLGAVPHWRPGKSGRIQSYRQMLINHEFGHRIGKSHAYCSGEGKRAPVMQQQTYGLQSCLANPWPLTEELPR